MQEMSLTVMGILMINLKQSVGELH